MADIDVLRGRLRQELHDEDSNSYRWTDAVLDRHLLRATRELSLVLPREQVTTLATGAGTRELSLSTLSDLVLVEAVEYPAGRWPPEFVQFQVFAGTLTLLVAQAPAAGEDVRVYWGSLHSLDDEQSTLPAAVEDVVVLGAGGYAAVEWANFAANRANVAGTEAFVNYRGWGADALRRFHAQLETLGRNARLRASSLFAPGGQAPSQSVVQWEG